MAKRRRITLAEDADRTRPERHFPSGAAQTRIVSVARIWLDSRKSVRSFKGIICGDISEFESSHPSHAVRLCGPLLWQSLAWDTGFGRFWCKLALRECVEAAWLCEAHFSAVARFEHGLLHLVALNNLSREETQAFHNIFPRPPARNFAMGRAFVEGR
jgi:hypothetical protein